MAHGDVGGAVTELVITCVTRKHGGVDIIKGMALVQSEEDYGVEQWNRYGDRLFGQALAEEVENEQAIPVKVRGICIFAYDDEDDHPEIGGKVMMSSTHGVVCGADSGSPNGTGIVLKVDTTVEEVHVLI